MYLKKWFNYCGRERNPLKPDKTTVVRFLSNLFDTGLSYTAINTARSAISTFMKKTGDIDIHKNEIINRFMKGVHNGRPMLLRHTHTWDVNMVLKYVENMDISSLLSLSQKLSMLFLLTTAQCQSLHVLKTSDITISTLDVTITFNSILKTTRPGSHQKPIKIRRYNNEKLNCEHARTIFNRNTVLAKGRLSVDFNNKTAQTCVQTNNGAVMRCVWVSEHYKPHSTRAATTLWACYRGVPLTEIIKTAGWTLDKCLYICKIQ